MVEDFELDNLIYTIKEQILRNEENIAEEVVDKYYIDFANILYSYIKSNKDINYKYIQDKKLVSIKAYLI